MLRPTLSILVIGLATVAAVDLPAHDSLERASAVSATITQGPASPASPAAGRRNKVEETFPIYPNPATNVATIDLDSVRGTAERVEVTDMRGEKWIDLSITSGQKVVELQTAQLMNGVYLVTVTTSVTKAATKLIVQH